MGIVQAFACISVDTDVQENACVIRNTITCKCERPVSVQRFALKIMLADLKVSR